MAGLISTACCPIFAFTHYKEDEGPIYIWCIGACIDACWCFCKKYNSIYAQAPLHIHRDEAWCQDDGANDSVVNSYKFAKIVHIILVYTTQVSPFYQVKLWLVGFNNFTGSQASCLHFTTLRWEETFENEIDHFLERRSPLWPRALSGPTGFGLFLRERDSKQQIMRAQCAAIEGFPKDLKHQLVLFQGLAERKCIPWHCHHCFSALGAAGRGCKERFPRKAPSDGATEVKESEASGTRGGCLSNHVSFSSDTLCMWWEYSFIGLEWSLYGLCSCQEVIQSRLSPHASFEPSPLHERFQLGPATGGHQKQ